MKAYPPRKHYRWHAGFIAWLLHRITGVALALYLMIHIVIISSLARGPESFDATMKFLHGFVFRLLEVGLLAAVLFHTFNGVRIVLLDYGNAAQKELIVRYVIAVFVLTGVLTVAGGIGILWG
ncbi:MAG: succinate dehydrogenase, cytochrome b556 subunit [Proteobacteria bacterium]|nr:succinate dehydrogenase, cytochrome b556 subunit [Pseudomonadota bacterium]MBU1741707.1 succinate dehydrogenase, cytochrome b556 subunit [Pseudomonadota bacterium]